ncbi:MAG: hypothetical protein AAFY98_01650 [Verrucomicrobiota bacterium]
MWRQPHSVLVRDGSLETWLRKAQREQASTNTPESAPKKAALPIRRQDEKIGRNDMVVIKRGEETQTMKWKKAEPMVNGGGWTYVKKAD